MYIIYTYIHIHMHSKRRFAKPLRTNVFHAHACMQACTCVRMYARVYALKHGCRNCFGLHYCSKISMCSLITVLFFPFANCFLHMFLGLPCYLPVTFWVHSGSSFSLPDTFENPSKHLLLFISKTA